MSDEEEKDNLIALQAKRICQLELKLQRVSSIRQLQQQQQNEPQTLTQPLLLRQQPHQGASRRMQSTNCPQDEHGSGGSCSGWSRSRSGSVSIPSSDSAFSENGGDDDGDGGLCVDVTGLTRTQELHHEIDTLKDKIKELTTENDELVADFQCLLHEQDETLGQLEGQGTRIQKLNKLNRHLRCQRDELAEEVELFRHRQEAPTVGSTAEVLQLMTDAQRQMRCKQKRFAHEQKVWELSVAAALKEKNDMADELYKVSKSQTKLTQRVEQYQRGLQKQTSDVKQLLDAERALYEAAKFSSRTAQHNNIKAARPASNLVVQKCHDQTERLRKLLFDAETSLSVIRTPPIRTAGSVQSVLTITRGLLLEPANRSLPRLIATTDFSAIATSDATNNGALSSHHSRQVDGGVESASDVDDCSGVSGMASVSSFANKMVTTGLDLGRRVSSTSIMESVTKGGQWFLHDDDDEQQQDVDVSLLHYESLLGTHNHGDEEATHRQQEEEDYQSSCCSTFLELEAALVSSADSLPFIPIASSSSGAAAPAREYPYSARERRYLPFPSPHQSKRHQAPKNNSKADDDELLFVDFQQRGARRSTKPSARAQNNVAIVQTTATSTSISTTTATATTGCTTKKKTSVSVASLLKASPANALSARMRNKQRKDSTAFLLSNRSFHR
jgi:hypothetical protein